MVLVPANMYYFGFSLCKFILLFLVPTNMSCFGFGHWPHFCDDLHMWHMMTEPIFRKIVPAKYFDF